MAKQIPANLQQTLFAATVPGLEAMVYRELEQLGLKGLQMVAGGVSLRGNLRKINKRNWLNWRIAMQLGHRLNH